MTKAEAEYEAQSRHERYCDECSMFRPPGGCSLVEGRISPIGWCRYWESRARKGAR